MLQIKISFYTQLDEEKCFARIWGFNPTFVGKEKIMLTVAKMTIFFRSHAKRSGDKNEKSLSTMRMENNAENAS